MLQSGMHRSLMSEVAGQVNDDDAFVLICQSVQQIATAAQLLPLWVRIWS